MSMSHEHAVCGGMHPRQGKGNAIQGLALVCLWRSVEVHGVETEPVGWETG